MGVAQLASHSLHYLNSRSRPIFHFLRRLPQRSRRRRAPTSEPIGRGGNTALVGAALRADRTTSCPHTHKYGRGAIGFSFAPLPQLSLAPDFFISCGFRRSGHAGGVPLPANPSVGEQHRLGRGGTPCRPPATDALERRPYHRVRPQRTHWKCVPTTASAPRNGRLGKASLPANLLVGACLTPLATLLRNARFARGI